MIRYFTLFAFLSFHLTVFSQDYHPTKLFVKFKENTSLDNIDYTASKSFSNLPLSALQKTFVNFQVKSIVKTSKIKKEAFQRIYTLSIADSLKLDQLILELQKFPEIELVERVPVYQTFFTPNDLHPNQWHLPKINALQAWDISTGSTAITVAIVDDAVKIDHEDLQNNIWVNPGEIPNNGIDDDNNGYIDDVNGYDVADWDNDPRPPSFATNSVFTHGTHCAGIAAAVSNNGKGIASIGYSVKIIPIKTKLSSTSDGTLTATYDGVEYAINAGARVISMSWGGGGYSSIFQSLFDYAHAQGIVLVAAAGNSSSSAPFYPAAYNNVISVGATDNTDHVAYFSNYGTTIDIMAPGVNIWSTLAGSTSSYGYLSGTSMACPLVAGSAALILSSKPTLLPLSLENCIKNSADNINALNPAYIGLMGGGRINVYNAIRCASSSIYADFTANNTTICGGASVTFTDLSSGSVTGWNWSFPGGIPSTSTLKNPVVSYPVNGTYNASLTAYNGTVSGSITKTAYITVYQPGATLSGNNTIVAGDITYLKIDFNGVAPFSFSVSDGSTIINQNNAYSNPYYLSVSPNSTKTYTLTAFSDNNCSGTFTGSAIITVTTASGNNPTVCPTTDGLIAYYPFLGNANDGSGNGNNSGSYNSSFAATGKDGASSSAISFNGTNLFPVNNTLGNFGTADFSCSFWFNAASLKTMNRFMSKRVSVSWDNYFSFEIYNYKLVSELSESASRYYQIGGTTIINPNTWYHAVFLRRNNELFIYLNGQKETTTIDAGILQSININNSYDFLFGNAYQSAGFPFSNQGLLGRLDEVRIYNRALSDCEIAQLYDCNAVCGSSSSTFCPPPYGLVGSYPFSGSTLDVSGNNRNGTIVGTGISLTTDRFGNPNSAYDFDQNLSDGIMFPMNNRSVIGISLWFNANGTNTLQYPTFFLLDNDFTLNTGDVSLTYFYSSLVRNGSPGNFFARVANIGDDFIPSDPIVVTPNVWHHYYCEYDGVNNKLKFYLDGVLTGTKNLMILPIILNNNYLRLGRQTSYLGNEDKFLGQMDDINVYNRTLSDCEIAKLYDCNSTCGLVASYPFCSNPNDISSNQLNGTISGNVTLQPDRFNIPNTSYNFGGGFTDVILVDNKSNLLTLQNFSVSFWIKRSRTNIKEDLFLSILGGGWGLYINNVNNLSFTKVDWNQAYSNFTLNDLNWHHCAIVTTNSQTTFYLDGVNSITQPYARTILGASLYSFGNRYLTNEGFQGQLDDFKIYNKLLTDAEVLTLFNEAPPCNDGPIASYPFCGNTSDVIGSNNGTLTGATLTTDRFGNTNSAYYFDGSDYIRINRNISQDFSISFWFKTTILGGNCGTSNTQWHCGLGLIDADRSDCRDDFGTSINNGRVDFGIGSAICGDERYLATPGQFNDNTWHHVVAVRSISGFTKLYVDNVLLSYSTSNSRSLTDPKRITFGGMEDTDVGEDVIINYFIGYLDDIKIYDRVISQQEINTLYNAPAPCTSPCILSITGNNTGCLTQNSIYSVFPSNLNNITWTVTGGNFTRLSGNTISVNWTSPGTNMIIARETVCGITFSLPVNVTCCIDISSINISGPSTGCLKDSLSSNIYEIDGALPYNFQWIVTGGTFRQIAPNAISVIWTSKGTNSISASQTICGIIKSKPVFVSCCNASSTSILGSAIVCEDSSYIYQTSNVSVSDVYNWTISGGTLTKLNNYSAKVVWNSIGNRSIYAYEGQCQTAASLDVTVNLCGNQPRTITGANSGCYNSNLTYKVTNTTNSSTFAWIVIGGGYVPSGNNSIIVNWTSIGHNFVSAIDLSSGKTYTFSVNINCCSNNVPADALPPISVDFSELDMICNTVGTVALKGGSPPGGFYWYQGIASNYLVVSKGGDFPLTYQYTDQYQCTNTVAGVLSVKLCTVPGPCDMAVPPCTCPGYTCPPPFKIYSAITPNGDQFNDYWVMDSLPPDLKVSIMDRWGNMLFHDDHYLNNWDGRSSDGEKLPSGIYYYIVEFEPGKRRYTGTISIIRD